MAKKSNVKSVHQIPPTRRLVRPRCYPVVEDSSNASERVYRPARSISQQIKQGLVKGITKDIASTNGNSYDKAEGRCPVGMRLDVDTFDLATRMLRNGGDIKSVTKDMTKTDD